MAPSQPCDRSHEVPVQARLSPAKDFPRGFPSEPEMYREQSFSSTQTGSWETSEGSPERKEGSLPRPRTWHPATRDYKLKMMAKTFLQANGFMHINEAQHSWGRTRYPLHVAVSQNKPAIVKALLLLGARRNVKTRRGLTPEDLARRSGFQEVLNILEQATLQKESTLETFCSTNGMASIQM
mmetsp:Transcript_99107/g.137668  ORF Transcript_99107/g.137668 Transcript_99107/m.137668 type:complete len:182 (+) Transcript_99107:106-651(+)